MTYRPELPPLTDRIRRLPVHRGYPVPWFVAWLGPSGEPLPRGQGEPDFRVIAPDALDRAYFGELCWICGTRRDVRAAFVVGPMCAVNRTSAEPPSHPECAGWAACACPFLARPYAHRREGALPEAAVEPAGLMLRRNPGVALAWVSQDWRRWRVPQDWRRWRVPNGVLYDIGTPEEVAWYAEGRAATRGEVVQSIETGLPALRELAEQEGPAAAAELDSLVRVVLEEIAPR